MKVKVISRFNDRENDFKTRKVGETFVTNDERGKILITKGFVTEVTENKTKAKTE